VGSGNDVGTHVGTLTRTKHQRAHVNYSLKNVSMGVAESWRFIEDQPRALAIIRYTVDNEKEDAIHVLSLSAI